VDAVADLELGGAEAVAVVLAGHQAGQLQGLVLEGRFQALEEGLGLGFLFDSQTQRALLDGHIALARRHADAARFPAIDVLRSLSRMMPEIVTPDHRGDAALVRRAIASLEEAEDLFAIGASRPGSDAWLDACVDARPAIEALIFDGAGARADPIERLASIAQGLRNATKPDQAIA
jgi:hypothetical protein